MTPAQTAYHAALRVTRETLHRWPWLDRDEVLSDACLGATHALNRYDPARGVPLDGYAFYRARRAVLDGIRYRLPLTRDGHPRKPEVSLEALLPFIPHPRSPEPERAVDDRDQLTRILNALPAEQASVLREHDLAERTLADIARSWGVSESAVCKLRKRALAHARTLA